MAENGGMNSMKKKYLLGILPALLVLSSCQAAPKENNLKEETFIEDTLAHDEIFGQGGEFKKLTPYKDPVVPSDPSLKKPAIGVQYKDDGEGKFAIRYVAAIADLDVEAHWTRGICDKNGGQQKTPNSKFVDKVVTTAYTAVSADSDSGDPIATPASVGEGFNYFVVYTLREVPADQVDSYLFAYLTLEKGGDSVTSDALISRIGGGNAFSYDFANTGYFLQGTVNGVQNAVIPLDDDPSAGNYAQEEGLTLAANDSFGVFKVAADHFQCFGYDSLRRGAPFLPHVASNNYLKVNVAGDYNLYLTDSNQIHIVVPEAAKANATYYLKPNANWASAGARFAAYFFNNETSESEWADMIDAGDGFYSVNKPNGNYPNVIFCRMNGAAADNIWGNKWNQTDDLSLDDIGNTYFINDESWNEGNWNTHAF